jgi:hypothetical protein
MLSVIKRISSNEIEGGVGKFTERWPLCTHLKPHALGLMVVHWRVSNFAEVVFYHLITAVGFLSEMLSCTL